MKILVIGNTGFIGSNLNLLLSDKFELKTIGRYEMDDRDTLIYLLKNKISVDTTYDERKIPGRMYSYLAKK